MDGTLLLPAFGFGLLSIFAVIALLLLILNIWMLVDALKRENWKSDIERLTWIVLLALGIPMAFGTVVSVVYYFAVYRNDPRA